MGCSADIPADTVPAFELLDEVTLLMGTSRCSSFSTKWFFPEDKIDERAPSKKKLNTIELPTSFLPRDRPRVVPSAAPWSLRSVYFAVETWPQALLC